MRKNQSSSIVELSALLVDLEGGAPTEIKLVPCGKFRSARDSRPIGIEAWVMNAANAEAILSAQAQLKSQFLIDYDHQTIRADKNGQPAPASGWGGEFEWREGDGLYAVKVQWTAAALAAINNKEYRYISPVIKFDPVTGDVTGVPMAALVNFPALDGLNDLAAAAAQLFSNPMEPNMELDELLERLRYLFNLPTLATIDDISAELDKAKALISKPDGTTEGLSALLTAKADEITALSEQISDQVDPAKYAPVSVVNDLRDQIAALSGEVNDSSVEKLIKDGVANGKIIGDSMKSWLTDLGKKDISALSGFLDSAASIIPVARKHADKPPTSMQTEALSATPEELAVANQMGIDIESLIKQRGN